MAATVHSTAAVVAVLEDLRLVTDTNGASACASYVRVPSRLQRGPIPTHTCSEFQKNRRSSTYSSGTKQQQQRYNASAPINSNAHIRIIRPPAVFPLSNSRFQVKTTSPRGTSYFLNNILIPGTLYVRQTSTNNIYGVPSTWYLVYT